MNDTNYRYEDAVAALRLIYECLPQRKKGELSSYLIDIMCYLRLHSPSQVERVPVPLSNGQITVPGRG